MNNLILDRSTWKNILCDDLNPSTHVRGAQLRECDHTEDEHFAFDSGVYAGEQETAEGQAVNPYSSDEPALYEAWEAGYACSRLTESEMVAKENESS